MTEDKKEEIELIEELNELLPKMSVDVPSQSIMQKEECIITDGALLGIYDEVLDIVRKDREELDGVLANFIDMVMNEGDGSSASKEAIVGLIKIKSESADRMTKIADLMTRVKMKDRDTYKPYLNAQQNNKTSITIEGGKRELLKSINKIIKKQKEEEK